MKAKVTMMVGILVSAISGCLMNSDGAVLAVAAITFLIGFALVSFSFRICEIEDERMALNQRIKERRKHIEESSNDTDDRRNNIRITVLLECR